MIPSPSPRRTGPPGTSSPRFPAAFHPSTSSSSALITTPLRERRPGRPRLPARILSGGAFDFTLKFVCFSAEEWGLYGSQHYAQAARQAGAKILGVLNMDMIAYTDVVPEDLDLFVNEASAWLVYRFMLCAKQYVAIDLSSALNPDVRASDHSSFWDQGYCALLAIEDYPVTNPYYHKTTDVLATLNLDFAATVTKIVLAVAAGIAQPVLQ
jgi:Zn-dependent M28 family amino/carboxypeptidase